MISHLTPALEKSMMELRDQEKNMRETCEQLPV